MKNKKITSRKSERLIHALGHDVKQPLGLIRAYSYYIKKSLQNPSTELLQYPEKIDQQVDLLTVMLNNIVESTKLSEHGITFKQTPVELISLLKNIFIELKDKYPDANFTLDCDDKKYMVKGDELHLHQAFYHLLENALQYSDKTQSVSVELRKNAIEILIYISDTGIGIPTKEIKNIFEEFYRATNSKEAGSKGLGLGLYIAKAIIEGHQGKLQAKSVTTDGTTFTVALPLLKK